VIANWLEIHWLTRYPWPTEITMDKGSEFAREVSETLKNEHGIKRKIITSRNPQSNSMIERCSDAVTGDMLARHQPLRSKRGIVVPNAPKKLPRASVFDNVD